MVAMLDSARDAGHLDPSLDTNLLAELLVAPIFFRRLMTPTPFPVEEVYQLVKLVLDPHWR